MKTLQEILKEITSLYTQDTRAIHRYNLYEVKTLIHKNNIYNPFNHCLKDEYKDLHDPYEPLTLDTLKKLKPEYLRPDIQFWRDLQSLHLIDCLWTPKGLSKLGHQFVKTIQNNYSDT